MATAGGVSVARLYCHVGARHCALCLFHPTDDRPDVSGMDTPAESVCHHPILGHPAAPPLPKACPLDARPANGTGA